MKKEVDLEKYNSITHKIIGCAMSVHNELGNGFQEVIYQRALAIEYKFINYTPNRFLKPVRCY